LQKISIAIGEDLKATLLSGIFIISNQVVGYGQAKLG
jgi:hypothetical protein